MITHDQSSDTIARKIDAYKLLLMEYIYIYVLVKKINPFKTHFSLLDIFLINLITKIQRIYKIKSVYII